jgi:hypothetical protein
MDSPASPVEVTGFWRLYSKLFPSLRNPLPNPGKFEDRNHESKSTHCEDFFDGLKFSLGRNFSHFSVVHNLHFKPGSAGPQQAPMEHSYDLDLNFQTAGIAGSEWILGALTRTNKKGEVNAQIVAKPSDETTLSCNLSLPGNAEGSGVRAGAQVDGKSFVITGHVGKPEQLELSLFQSVTEKLSVGGQANLLSQQNPFTGELVQLNVFCLGARYNTEKWAGQFSCKNPASISPEFNASYTHRVKDLGHLSVEMDHILAHKLPRNSVSDAQKVTFGLELKGSQSANRFRAFVNTHGVVGSMLEMSVANARITLGLQMDHTLSEFKCAFQLIHFFYFYFHSLPFRHGLGVEVQL